MCFQEPQVEITFPVGALSLDVVNLAINELVSDLFQSREVRILLLVHHEDHSSARWRKGGRLLLAIIQTGPFKMRVADEVGLAVSVAIYIHRIVAISRIWPVSGVTLCSSDYALQVIGVVIYSLGHQIDHSREYTDFLEIRKVAQLEGLEVELKLKAVSAVELLPVLVIVGPELPGPVEVFNCFNLFNHLLGVLFDYRGVLGRKLKSIRL